MTADVKEETMVFIPKGFNERFNKEKNASLIVNDKNELDFTPTSEYPKWKVKRWEREAKRLNKKIDKGKVKIYNNPEDLIKDLRKNV